jgi:hypothetical protein
MGGEKMEESTTKGPVEQALPMIYAFMWKYRTPLKWARRMVWFSLLVSLIIKVIYF